MDGLPRLEARVRQALLDVSGLRLASTGGTGVEQTYQARAVALTYTISERAA